MDENLKRTAIHVRRQLEGDQNPNLYRDIIGSLRNYTHGIDSMREIADFYAHREGREKGLITEHCRIFFEHLHFKMMQMKDGSAGPEFPITPKRITRYVLSTLDGKIVYNFLQIRKKEAARRLESALSKTVEGHGKLLFNQLLSIEEEKTLNFCLSWVVAESAFISKSIVKDYARLLLANKLISDTDKPKVAALENSLAMHLIDTMHKMTIRIDAKSKAVLAGHIDNDGKLSITALGDYRDSAGRHTRAHGHVLLTELNAVDYLCDEYLDASSDEAKLREDMFIVGATYDSNAPLGGPYPKNYTFKDFVEIRGGKLCPLA